MNNNNKHNIVLGASLPQRRIKLTATKSQEGEDTKLHSHLFIQTATLPRRFREKFLTKYNQSPTRTAENPHNNMSSTMSTITTIGRSIMSVNSQSSTTSSSSSCESASSSLSEKTTCLKSMHSKQLEVLNKFVDKFLKAINYLEQIILKNKYEIIASSITAILEAVLDIYNVIQSFGGSSMITTENNTVKTSNNNLITSSSSFKAYRSKINVSLANLIKWSDSILFLNSTSKFFLY